MDQPINPTKGFKIVQVPIDLIKVLDHLRETKKMSYSQALYHMISEKKYNSIKKIVGD